MRCGFTYRLVSVANHLIDASSSQSISNGGGVVLSSSSRALKSREPRITSS